MPASGRAIARATDRAFLGRFDGALDALRGLSGEESRWVRAYVAASRGRFNEARALAEPLARSARSRKVRVAAAITFASVLRQTGRHARAETFDRSALAQARTEGERVHALIGLAADAIGRGRVAACDRRLAEAASIRRADGWRAQVRLDWVRVERALTVGRPSEALAPGRRALRASRAAGAERHVAKSRLFLGVALADAGSLVAARRELAGAWRAAQSCGASRVARVARDVLDEKGMQAAG